VAIITSLGNLSKLSNIFSNAIKYSPKNDTITANLFVRNGSGFIEIKDNGEGANQETVAEIRRSKEQVKDPRFQVSNFHPNPTSSSVNTRPLSSKFWKDSLFSEF
jgi:hypothetical protein